MREVVLDTSALLYWTLDPTRLTVRAVHAIADAERCLVSVVSLWEVALKTGRGALELPLSVDEYMRRLERADRVEIAPLDQATVVAGAQLQWEHRDPADRWIVALARSRTCALVSSDKRIREFYESAVCE